MKKIDLAYLAGIVDGEGCISTAMRQKRTPFIIVSLSNTHKNTIDYIRNLFGGVLRKRVRKEFCRKTSYVLRWQGIKALDLLKILLPYLKIKRKQAKLAIICPFVGSGNKLSDKQREIRFRVRKKLHEINGGASYHEDLF